MRPNHQTGNGQDLIQLPNHSHTQSIKKLHKANKQEYEDKQKKVSETKNLCSYHPNSTYNPVTVAKLKHKHRHRLQPFAYYIHKYELEICIGQESELRDRKADR
jgi:uncharacterized Rmd1/YagE family protein